MFSDEEGRKETITISFLPPDKVITEPTIYVNGIIGFLRFPLPVNHDACQGYGLTCPLKSYLLAKFVYSVDSVPSVIAGNNKLELLIKDQNNNMVICGMIDLEVA